MSRTDLSIALVILSLAAPVAIPSQVFSQGPPIQTDTPIMLGLEGRGARIFLKVLRMDEVLEEGDTIEDPLDRSVTVFLYPVVVPYNLGAATQLGVVAPFLTKDFESNAGNATPSGFGDLTLFVKHLLVQVDRRAETFRLALKGSAKFPTGDDEELPPLGTGSFDYGLSAVAAWIKSRWGLYAETIYIHRTSNDDVDLGDRFSYNAALGFRLVPTRYTRYPQPQVNLYLELNGSVGGHSEVSDLEDPNSGGSTLFLSSGVQYVGGRRWLVEASLQLPIVDEPNGTQLGTAWTALFGTRILIF